MLDLAWSAYKLTLSSQITFQKTHSTASTSTIPSQLLPELSDSLALAGLSSGERQWLRRLVDLGVEALKELPKEKVVERPVANANAPRTDILDQVKDVTGRADATLAKKVPALGELKGNRDAPEGDQSGDQGQGKGSGGGGGDPKVRTPKRKRAG